MLKAKDMSKIIYFLKCFVCLVIAILCLIEYAAGEPRKNKIFSDLKQANRFINFSQTEASTPIYIKLEAEDFANIGAENSNAPWQQNMSWYPQWSRGGASGWWGVKGSATAATDAITKEIYVPQDGEYFVWTRYQDYFGEPESFNIVVDYSDGKAKAEYGTKDINANPDSQIGWSYVWDKRIFKLKKGSAKISIELEKTAKVSRAVDALILTNDANWIPTERGFPPQAYSKYLLDWAKDRKPLKPLIEKRRDFRSIPNAWKPAQIAKRDFWYLGANEMIDGYPFPINIRPESQNPDTAKAFVKRYNNDPASAPIFGSPLNAVQISIARTGELLNPENPLRQYILNKKRPFVLVGNYSSAGRIKNSYSQLKQIFGELWIGIVSGENTYLNNSLFPENSSIDNNFKDENYQWLPTGGKNNFRREMSADWASEISDPYEKIILALSVGTFPHVHQTAEAGAQILAAESAGAMPYIQAQTAFVRGAARQYNRPWMWYFGASFGSSIRTFTREDPYIIDLDGLKINSRDEVVGPSLAHIRRTLLFAYLQGANFVFPEQGYNLFDTNGNLNPMGWSYDEMLRLAARHPNRGVINTPVAVLLDKMHGWDKYTYNGMRIWNKKTLERSDQMINQFFNVAYYPFPKNEGDYATDLNVPFPNGYFGDIFDVLVTSRTNSDLLSAYPAVFCAGDIKPDDELSARLKKYVENGGTLVINSKQLTSETDESFLGVKLESGQKESAGVICERDGEKLAGTTFPYRTAKAETAQVIARTANGDPIAFLNKFGKGQVILTTASYLLGYDEQPMPYMAHLLLELTSGLQPVEIRGNCQYFINLRPDGYVVTLSNNEGLEKLSDSPAKMNFDKTVEVSLRIKDKPIVTEDWLGDEKLSRNFPNEWLPEYTRSKLPTWKREDNFYKTNVKLLPGEIRVYFIKTAN